MLTQNASRRRRKSASTTEHENETADPVADQDVEAIAQCLRTVPPDLDRESVGQPRARFGHPLLHARYEIEDLLVADAVDADQDRGRAVEGRVLIVFLEAVDDVCDVPSSSRVPSFWVTTTMRSNSSFV